MNRRMPPVRTRSTGSAPGCAVVAARGGHVGDPPPPAPYPCRSAPLALLGRYSDSTASTITERRNW
jgi:hypothetical protein